MTELSRDLLEALPGLHSKMPEPFRKLARLIMAGEFEWLGDGRVVYLMNDAVESFLVFHNYRLTGNYLSECEEPVTAELERRDADYLLIVRQGEENAFTLTFEALTELTFCYNYGSIGHFWVKGQEHIRQLEYRLAILGDKLEYLGAEYCNAEEQKLAKLAHFPPFADYVAVPEKYLGDWRHDWVYSEEAAQFFAELSREAGDDKLESAVLHYMENHSEKSRQMLAREMKRAQHRSVFVLLEQKLKEASAEYPDRSYETELSEKMQRIMEQVCREEQNLQKQGYVTSVLREEPFANTPDDFSFHGYVMYWKPNQRWSKVCVLEVIDN